MSIKDIRLFGDPVLRTPAAEVVDFDKELRQLVKDLTDTMLEAPGAGLAAPQIGVGLRVFTYYVDKQLGHLINPSLDLSSDMQDGEEGCLSFPGIFFDTPRALRVVAKGWNEHGEPVTLEGSELMARCIQHETDHLDGILFIDRMDRAQRKLAMKAIRDAEWAGEHGADGPAQPPLDLRQGPVARCGSSSPAPPRSPCPASRRSSRPPTRSSRCSPVPTPASGRGRALVPSPVRVRAEALGLEVLTPPRAGDPGFRRAAGRAGPRRLPRSSRTAASSRPRCWPCRPPAGSTCTSPCCRPGAAPRPVQHAVMAGDEVTGATTFRLEEGLDTGPTYGVMTETIRPTDTAGDLLQRLSTAGAGLLVATLDGLQSGTLQAVPQPGEGISHAPKITVEDARVRWDRPALAVDRQVRGCTPAPGAWSTFRGERLKLLPVAPVADGPAAAPGEIVADRRSVHVGTATGAVRLGTVQPHGRKPMAAADWARGVRPDQGEKLGDD